MDVRWVLCIERRKSREEAWEGKEEENVGKQRKQGTHLQA